MVTEQMPSKSKHESPAAANCSRLTVAPELSLDLIEDLLSGNSVALRIPHYYAPFQCAEVSKNLQSSSEFGYYENANNIGRVGMAYFETTTGDEAKRRYYTNSQRMINILRNCCTPYFSPIDRLRMELAEIWPLGARLENVDGRKMFVGLARVFGKGSEALPHQDILRRDAPHSPHAHELAEQIAANVYLQVPNNGGQLEVWDMSMSDKEYENMRLENSYGLDRKMLPEPDLVVTPEVGDLILFRSTCIHAVRVSDGESRIALSMFVGYRSHSRALSYWS